MARRTVVKIEGLKEVEAALAQLPKATGRNVMRRVGVKRLEPIAERAGSIAAGNNWSGDLAGSFAASAKAAGYAKRIGRKASEVEVYAGPAGRGGKAPPQGSQQEFGNVNHGPQASLRPAWDEEKGDILPGLADDFWEEISKAAKRIARKTARLAAKG